MSLVINLCRIFVQIKGKMRCFSIKYENITFYFPKIYYHWCYSH